MEIRTGVLVDTNRRKRVTVLSEPDKAGWFSGRTLGGKYLIFSIADVISVHAPQDDLVELYAAYIQACEVKAQHCRNCETCFDMRHKDCGTCRMNTSEVETRLDDWMQK